jgi:hypothetical protein
MSDTFLASSHMIIVTLYWDLKYRPIKLEGFQLRKIPNKFAVLNKVYFVISQ